MGILSLFFTGVGLSMDAFAASVCLGLKCDKRFRRTGFTAAAYFGGFQALMPALGWLLGRQFVAYIGGFGDWLAFILLGYIGGKMIYDGIAGKPEDEQKNTGRGTMLVLAVATSVDALAVGVTFALLDVPVLFAAILIGCTTFVLSYSGVWIGSRFDHRCQKTASIAGGVILCAIGLRILLQSL